MGRQIFMIFDPYPPPSAIFLLLSVISLNCYIKDVCYIIPYCLYCLTPSSLSKICMYHTIFSISPKDHKLHTQSTLTLLRSIYVVSFPQGVMFLIFIFWCIHRKYTCQYVSILLSIITSNISILNKFSRIFDLDP